MPQISIPQRVSRGLDVLNFTLADVRDGLGPYLAIYLLAVRGPEQGWNEATVGLVMTIAGLIGIAAQMPAGALIDKTHHKRAIIIAAAIAVTLSSLILPFISNFYLVAASQSVAAIAGTIFPPALAAVTLGLVGPKLFSRRIGRNESFNHAGNAVSAILAGILAYAFGPVVVFWLMALMAALSIGAMLMVPSHAIDHDVARGRTNPDHDEQHTHDTSIWRNLLTNRPLAVFAGLCLIFHLANAAMLTSVSQLLAREVGQNSATSLTAICIVAAQLVMIPMAMLVGRKAEVWGHKPIFLAAFSVLALRGALYPLFDHPYYLVSVQMLDGVGAGIYGALFPLVVASLTRGSGRFNISQGAVATAQGIGAALSASLAGVIIISAGYSAVFFSLSAIALLGAIGYWLLMPSTR